MTVENCQLVECYQADGEWVWTVIPVTVTREGWGGPVVSTATSWSTAAVRSICVDFVALDRPWGIFSIVTGQATWLMITKPGREAELAARAVLTTLQTEGFNGCGGKGAWFRPPHWFDTTLWCDRHDVAYLNGGYESDREKADWQLRSDLMHMADKAGVGLLKRIWFRIQGITFWYGIRLCGWSYFTYNCPKPVGWIDYIGKRLRHQL